MQLEGLFDIPPTLRSEQKWHVDLALPKQWNIGLIVGPSGSGKSTIAREIFGEHLTQEYLWDERKSIVDSFPPEMSIKDIIELLSSVGFSSPPSWLRPFNVLSNGEQFRVTIARTLAEKTILAVVDEFTSVVDRTVAQIASAAIAKSVRHRNQKFIGVSCHYDIIDWLEPDWVYQPQLNELKIGRHLWRRPSVVITIYRVHSSAWQLFRKHHYLDHGINPTATCFIALFKDNPAAFTAWLPFAGRGIKSARRAHRTVTLPDYQGIGIGNALSEHIASMWTALGMRAFSTSSHPALVRRRLRSRNWKMVRKTALGRKDSDPTRRHAHNRLTTGFEYIGTAMDRTQAEKLRYN